MIGFLDHVNTQIEAESNFYDVALDRENLKTFEIHFFKNEETKAKVYLKLYQDLTDVEDKYITFDEINVISKDKNILDGFVKNFKIETSSYSYGKDKLRYTGTFSLDEIEDLFKTFYYVINPKAPYVPPNLIKKFRSI